VHLGNGQPKQTTKLLNPKPSFGLTAIGLIHRTKEEGGTNKQQAIAEKPVPSCHAISPLSFFFFFLLVSACLYSLSSFRCRCLLPRSLQKLRCQVPLLSFMCLSVFVASLDRPVDPLYFFFFLAASASTSSFGLPPCFKSIQYVSAVFSSLIFSSSIFIFLRLFLHQYHHYHHFFTFFPQPGSWIS
jgi:hypothetical protein